MIATQRELYIALQETSDDVNVTESLYYYFLGVLPPRKIGDDYYIFQEGGGELLRFSKIGDKFYCHILSDTLITLYFNIQVEVSRKDVNALFRVLSISRDDGTCNTPLGYEDFISAEYGSITSLANDMNVTFHV